MPVLFLQPREFGDLNLDATQPWEETITDMNDFHLLLPASRLDK
jgi:hypothetical protein